MWTWPECYSLTLIVCVLGGRAKHIEYISLNRCPQCNSMRHTHSSSSLYIHDTDREQRATANTYIYIYIHILHLLKVWAYMLICSEPKRIEKLMDVATKRLKNNWKPSIYKCFPLCSHGFNRSSEFLILGALSKQKQKGGKGSKSKPEVWNSAETPQLLLIKTALPLLLQLELCFLIFL